MNDMDPAGWLGTCLDLYLNLAGIAVHMALRIASMSTILKNVRQGEETFSRVGLMSDHSDHHCISWFRF